MPDRTFYGFSADSFVIDPETGNATVQPDYERVRFEVSDNDMFADGDDANDEVGDDANQTADVFNEDGSSAGSGRIYVEEVRWYETSDGSMFSVTVFEIDGEPVGYIPSERMEEGTEFTFVGTSEAGEKMGGQNNNASRNNYNTYEANSANTERSEPEPSVCFGPGTMITTQEGDMPVEWLETSDSVLTRDHGFQPILWIGRTKIPAGYFRDYPDESPVCIPAGALGPNSPTHDLHVTGDHRIMIQSAAAELLFFSSEVLAPAKAWVDADRAYPVRVHNSYTVTHIVCAAHQIIAAQGAWVESMFTGDQALRRLATRDRLHLNQLLRGRMRQMQTARPCLTRKEARMLLADSPRLVPQVPRKRA